MLDLKAKARQEYDIAFGVYTAIRHNQMDFDQFYNGWLDDHDNQVFDEGFYYAIEEIEHLIGKAHKTYEDMRDSWPMGWDEYRKYDAVMHAIKQLNLEVYKLKNLDYESEETN